MVDSPPRRPRRPRPPTATDNRTARHLALAVGVLGVLAAAVVVWQVVANAPADTATTRAPDEHELEAVAEAPAAPASPPAATIGPPPPLGPDFVAVPAGAFVPSAGGRAPKKGEAAVHVTRPFGMQIHEVTQGEWRAAMGTSPSRHASCGGDCPVESVNFWEALAYANARSRTEGLEECYRLFACNDRRPGEGFECEEARWTRGAECRGYRLPTEAEWTLAAGQDGQKAKDREAMAWHHGNSQGAVRRVGTKRPNARGVYDLLGNVAEWCWDGWTPAPPTSGRDPSGPENLRARTRRGGSWHFPATYADPAARSGDAPSTRASDMGFRLVRTME